MRSFFGSLFWTYFIIAIHSFLFVLYFFAGKMREVHYHNLLAEIETVSSSYVSFSDQPSTTLSPLSQAQSTFNGQGTVHQPQRNCVQQSSMVYLIFII